MIEATAGDERDRSERILGCITLDGFIGVRSGDLSEKVEMGYTAMPVFLLSLDDTDITESRGSWEDRTKALFEKIQVGQTINARFVAPFIDVDGLKAVATRVFIQLAPDIRGRITRLTESVDGTRVSIFVEPAGGLESGMVRAIVSVGDEARVYVLDGSKRRVTRDDLQVNQIVEVTFGGVIQPSDPPRAGAFEVVILDSLE